ASCHAAPGARRTHLLSARVRYDELCGGGRRGRADVRREIGERDVGLMPDAGTDRPREPHERAHERLVVERREILRGTAAAREDHHIEVADLRETVECRDERLDSPDPL